MDHAPLLVTLLVIGAPLALFLSLRRRASRDARPDPAQRQDSHVAPPSDFGMARESSSEPARAAEPETSSAATTGAAAAAAGGAFILAVGAARHHASEGGGESPQAHPDTPGGGSGSDGSGDGDGGGGDL